MTLRPSRPRLLVATALTAVAGLALSAQPAAAVDVADWATLSADFAACAPAALATTLTADIDSGATDLVIPSGCDARIDLAGHELSVQSVRIAAGAQFTLSDSSPGNVGHLRADARGATDPLAGVDVLGTFHLDGAEVTAFGSGYASGIGAGTTHDAGLIVVDGGTITATGGGSGAGIGPRYDGTGGPIRFHGSTVTAVGGGGHPGVGGRSGPPITVAGTTLHATGGVNGSGIQGPLSVDRSVVVAQGGRDGAGIGGSNANADAWPVQILGPELGGVGPSTVTAVGGERAAGIGGGPEGPGGTVVVGTGGNIVHATGGAGATAIGGGLDATGGEISIGTGSTVTAIGGDGSPSALGSAWPAGPFGTLEVAGTLHLPQGELLLPRSVDDPAGTPHVLVESSGRILGTLAAPTSGAQLVGDGWIENRGVIALTEDLVLGGNTIEVTTNNFDVHFDAAGGTPVARTRVFAPTWDSGYRGPLPTSTRAGFTFAGWLTAAGPLTGDAALAPLASSPVLATARWTSGAATPATGSGLGSSAGAATLPVVGTGSSLLALAAALAAAAAGGLLLTRRGTPRLDS